MRHSKSYDINRKGYKMKTKVFLIALSLVALLPTVSHADASATTTPSSLTTTTTHSLLTDPIDASRFHKSKFLVSLSSKLKALTKVNFTVAFNPAKEVPGVVMVQDATHFASQDYRSNVLTLSAKSYSKLDAIQLLRVNRSQNPKVLWFSDNSSDTVSSTIDTILGKLYLTMKYGTLVTQSSNKVVFSYNFNVIDVDTLSSDDAMNLGDSLSGTYTLMLDKLGRVVLANMVDKANYCAKDCDLLSHLSFSYAPVKLEMPNPETVISIMQVDALPRLTDLEVASYDVAYKATELAIKDAKLVGSEYINVAASIEATPVGLVATYTSNGLKFTIDNDSLCVEPSDTKTTAIVTSCSVVTTNNSTPINSTNK